MESKYCGMCGVQRAITDTESRALCNQCWHWHKARNMSDTGHPLQDIEDEERLKLFKVTIPSQTLGIKVTDGTPFAAKKLTVGEITDYGFIQGREIVVLAQSHQRLYMQCLRELGCEPHEVNLRVEEIEGPFKHGYVIAYNQPDGL